MFNIELFFVRYNVYCHFRIICKVTLVLFVFSVMIRLINFNKVGCVVLSFLFFFCYVNIINLFYTSRWNFRFFSLPFQQSYYFLIPYTDLPFIYRFVVTKRIQGCY